MKKLLLFLFISAVVQAQEYQKLDTLQFSNVVNAIVSATDKNMVFKENQTRKLDQPYVRFANDKGENIFITYDVYMDGKNEALEIPGVKKFDLKSISGKFLTVFPVWKKFIDNSAEAEPLSQKKSTQKDVKNKTWSLNDYGSNIWVIKFSNREPIQKFENLIIPFTKSKKGYEFKKTIPKEVEEEIKKDFAKDENGNYTGYYDVLYLDDIPKSIKLKARTNR